MLVYNVLCFLIFITTVKWRYLTIGFLQTIKSIFQNKVILLFAGTVEDEAERVYHFWSGLQMIRNVILFILNKKLKHLKNK